MSEDKLLYLLKKYWAYDRFRDQQKEAIESVLSGKDTIVLFPTGGGKSLIYQIAGLALNGCCLVVTPLISLIQDQLKELSQKRIVGDYISGQKSKQDIQRILDNVKFGQTKFLFVSPERFQSKLFLEKVIELPISMLAIDEAHCLSTWGHDFRPAYLELKIIKSIFKSIPILSLTATATPKVLDDIKKSLLLEDPNVFRKSFKRNNIHISFMRTEDKNRSILRAIEKYKGSTIIYGKTRKETEKLSYFLNANGVQSSYYHAGMDYQKRENTQKNWFKNNPNVIVATTAFGMGINKSDVRLVIHNSIPASIEDYYQEIGRAGRDGRRSDALLVFNNSDVDQAKKWLNSAYPSVETISMVYNKLYKFFSLSYHSGEGQVRYFDIRDFFTFCHPIKSFSVYNALKILERNAWFQLDDRQKQLAAIKIPVQRRELLHVNDESLDKVLKYLLRNYDGLFFSYVKIDLKRIADALQIDQTALDKSLLKLAKFKLISYRREIEGHRIYFLRNRVRIEHLKLSKSSYENKKSHELGKLNSILNLLEEKENCIQSRILTYFEEQNNITCGVCHICRLNSKLSPSDLKWKVKELIESNEFTLHALIQYFDPVDKKTISKILHRMEDGEEILIDEAMQVKKGINW